MVIDIERLKKILEMKSLKKEHEQKKYNPICNTDKELIDDFYEDENQLIF